MEKKTTESIKLLEICAALEKRKTISEKKNQIGNEIKKGPRKHILEYFQRHTGTQSELHDKAFLFSPRERAISDVT